MQNELESVLDQCLTSLLHEGGTVEGCLRQYPAQAAELRPLLRTADEMNRALKSSRSPERTARIVRHAVRAASKPTKTGSTGLRLRPTWRWAAVGVTVVLILLLIAVIWGSAQGRAWPYPVWRLAAAPTRMPVATLRLSDDPAEIGTWLGAAGDRLDQVKTTYSQGRVDLAAIEALVGETDEVLAATERLPAAEGLAVLDRLLALLDDEEETLAVLVGSATKEAQPRLQQCMLAVRQQMVRAHSMVSRWRPGVPPQQQAITSTSPFQELPAEKETPYVVGTTRPSSDGLTPTSDSKKTPQAPGLTKTPQPPGQNKTPEPPGQNKTPEPPGLKRTVEPPGQDHKPQRPDPARTPQPGRKP